MMPALELARQHPLKSSAKYMVDVKTHVTNHASAAAVRVPDGFVRASFIAFLPEATSG